MNNTNFEEFTFSDNTNDKLFFNDNNINLLDNDINLDENKILTDFIFSNNLEGSKTEVLEILKKIENINKNINSDFESEFFDKTKIFKIKKIQDMIDESFFRIDKKFSDFETNILNEYIHGIENADEEIKVKLNNLEEKKKFLLEKKQKINEKLLKINVEKDSIIMTKTILDQSIDLKKKKNILSILKK